MEYIDLKWFACQEEWPLKIGITCYPTVGGSGVLATELGHQLAKRGHEVHFITYAIPFRLRLEEKNVFFHEVEVNQYDLFQYPDYALALAVKMAAVSDRYGLDILHVHYALPHASSAFLAKELMKNKRRPKVVTTLHGTDITLVGRDAAYFEVVKFSMEKSDGITAVSKSLCKETEEIFHLDKEISLIYNFFVPDKASIGGKNPYKESGKKLLVHASNFREVKRPRDVLKIFLRVREALPSKLLFVGEGKGALAIAEEVANLGLQNEVLFLGNSREMEQVIAGADLFLLPSKQESFGLAALEAMAYGVPVIATRAGGLPEVIEDGKSGFLEEVGDVEAMAEKACLLLQDPSLHQTIAKSAKARAEGEFSAEKIIPQYEAFYQSLF